MLISKPPWYFLVLLILAGESVFILPFVLSRIFRPTVLETFGLNNTELGFCFSLYGLVALVSYFFGGPLADRFDPRKLMALALWMTAVGGILYGTFPGYGTLRILYGYWGFTTIFLFWAPMIKATRLWGGKSSQGKAFGFLDGGRGLVGALFGVVGVYIFSLILPEQNATASFAEKQEAFKWVIWTSSSLVAFTGLLVWFFLKVKEGEREDISLDQISLTEIRKVLQLPSVWLLMVMILCAYLGYKSTDVISLYAKEVMLYDQVQSAQVGTTLLFMRPIIGITIGFIADRTRTTLWLFLSFGISFLGTLIFASGIISSSSTLLFMISVFIIAAGVYGARALYYAVMDRGQIPLAITGTAVGLISLVGYTPDIFAGPLMGTLLDSSPGEAGYQHVFWMVAGFSFVGSIAAWLYGRIYGKRG